MMSRALLFAAFAAVASAGISSGGSTVARTITNGMKGFTDVDGSTFRNFPDFMLGAEALVVDRDVYDSFFVEYECGVNEVCDLYFMTYRCHPCESKNIHALHAKLILEGWTPNSCGPTFSFKDGGHQHRFTVYHKEVTGSVLGDEFRPQVEADFVWAAVKPKTTGLCSNIYDMAECNNAYNHPECSWNVDLNQCKTSWCPKPTYVGPVTGCAVCAKDEYGEPNFDDKPRI